MASSRPPRPRPGRGGWSGQKQPSWGPADRPQQPPPQGPPPQGPPPQGPPPQGPPPQARPPGPPRHNPAQSPSRGFPQQEPPPPGYPQQPGRTPAQGPPRPPQPSGPPPAPPQRPAPSHGNHPGQGHGLLSGPQLLSGGGHQQDPPPSQRPPKKLTVTRVAALRGKALTGRGVAAFHRAATADGADRSGLTALTYATMLSYAVDAAIAVSLANTLFFSAATAESRGKVALYLLITVAPFALVAPVIGPMLDKLQRGRRAALAVSFAGRAVLAIVMAYHFDDWGLYPAALGVMVLSKSFVVLKAAVTPRVLPPGMTLVTTNSRLTSFGLVAGAVFGAFAAAFAWLFGSPGALVYTAVLCLVGTWLCLRIPAWVESTAGEVPTVLINMSHDPGQQPLTKPVVVSLWGNSAIRLLTGFFTLFIAFVVKAQSEQAPAKQLTLLGLAGAAAAIGFFAGNMAGARRHFEHSDKFILGNVAASVLAGVLAAALQGIFTAILVALVASATSALAKVCLDAVIQREMPEASRASAFGRSETVLQLAWVLGGALGVLMPTTYWIGFTVISVLVALLGVQTWLVGRGGSMVPRTRSRRRPQPAPDAAPRPL